MRLWRIQLSVSRWPIEIPCSFLSMVRVLGRQQPNFSPLGERNFWGFRDLRRGRVSRFWLRLGAEQVEGALLLPGCLSEEVEFVGRITRGIANADPVLRQPGRIGPWIDDPRGDHRDRDRPFSRRPREEKPFQPHIPHGGQDGRHVPVRQGPNDFPVSSRRRFPPTEPAGWCRSDRAAGGKGFPASHA